MYSARALRRAASSASASTLPSFSRGLFLGNLATTSAHPYPVKATLASSECKETLDMLLPTAQQFFSGVNDAALNDRNAAVPAAAVATLAEMGAFGMMVPEEFEGAGLSNTGYARMVEVVGAHDLGVGILLGASQSIGYKGILLYGTDAQKRKYLPDCASGRKIAAFALTEPGAGSDAAGVKTRAELSADGTHYVLTGSKIWISNGPQADVFTVFAKTPVDDAAAPGGKKDKMIALVVERAFGGVTSGPPEKKMGIKCSPTSEVFFENCKVPVENRLLGVGDGFKIAMGILNAGRFGMGAALTGTMKTCIAGALDYAHARSQFSHKLDEFAVVREKIAAMASRCYATESLAYLLAANMDRGMEDFQLEAACGKILASENATFCADETLQIFGGIGYMNNLPYERMVRDVRIFRIFEGTNEILRQMIGLTGLQTLGKELEPLARAAAHPLTGLHTLLTWAPTLARDRLRLAPARATGGGLSWAPPALRGAAQAVEDGAAAFAAAARVLVMRHGKKVIEQQLHVAKIADVVIDLTAATAAIARATAAVAAKAPAADAEVALANLYAEDARIRIAANIAGVTGALKRRNALADDVAAKLIKAQAYTPEHPTGL